MDPIEGIKTNTDTTLLLMREAYARGYRLHYYITEKLFMKNGEVCATTERLEFLDYQVNYYNLGIPETTNLNQMDVILMRQDPPFDMNYITSTYLLEKLTNPVFVNHPTAVRNMPEKLFVCDFPDLMPPTLISQDIELIHQFQIEHKEVVLKPLYASAGQGIFYINEAADNLSSIVEFSLQRYKAPLIVQKFIKEVFAGDKRVIMLCGEVLTVYNRLPKAGDFRANGAQGGSFAACSLSEYEIDMCKTIGAELKKNGIIFAGLDIIGNYLTEVNVTSPTGLVLSNQLYNKKFEVEVWDRILGEVNQ